MNLMYFKYVSIVTETNEDHIELRFVSCAMSGLYLCHYRRHNPSPPKTGIENNVRTVCKSSIEFAKKVL